MPKPVPAYPEEKRPPEVPLDIKKSLLELLDTFPISFLPYNDTAKVLLGDRDPWTLFGAATDVAGATKLASAPLLMLVRLANKAEASEKIAKTTAELIAKGYRIPIVRKVMEDAFETYIRLHPEKRSVNFADLPPEIRDQLSLTALSHPEAFKKTPIYAFPEGTAGLEDTAGAMMTDPVVKQGRPAKLVDAGDKVVVVDSRLLENRTPKPPATNIGTVGDHELDHVDYVDKYGNLIEREARQLPYESRPHEIRADLSAMNNYVKQLFLAGKISPEEAVDMQRALLRYRVAADNIAKAGRNVDDIRGVLGEPIAAAQAGKTLLTELMLRLGHRDVRRPAQDAARLAKEELQRINMMLNRR